MTNAEEQHAQTVIHSAQHLTTNRFVAQTQLATREAQVLPAMLFNPLSCTPSCSAVVSTNGAGNV